MTSSTGKTGRKRWRGLTAYNGGIELCPEMAEWILPIIIMLTALFKILAKLCLTVWNSMKFLVCPATVKIICDFNGIGALAT